MKCLHCGSFSVGAVVPASRCYNYVSTSWVGVRFRLRPQRVLSAGSPAHKADSAPALTEGDVAMQARAVADVVMRYVCRALGVRLANVRGCSGHLRALPHSALVGIC